MFKTNKLQTVQFLNTLEFRLPSPAYDDVWGLLPDKEKGNRSAEE